MHSTQITLFLESVFTNEALHHEIEHRIFELEPWKSMENNPEIEIEAFAYSTGILFRIRSFHLQIQDVINAFGELRNTKIPSFSHEEKRRFLREIEEREVDRREDFDSWAGEEFLKEFEDVPKIPEVTSFCDVFSRMSMVISDSEGWRYEEQKFLNTREVPALPLAKVSSKINDSYHLYHLYPTQNARELVTATIAANATREMLRKIFRTKGDAYDIYLSLHYERNFIYADYFWKCEDALNMREPLGIFQIPTLQAYTRALKESLFFAKIGQEDRSFGLNAIVGISPEVELKTYEDSTYSDFTKTLHANPVIIRGYGKADMEENQG